MGLFSSPPSPTPVRGSLVGAPAGADAGTGGAAPPILAPPAPVLPAPPAQPTSPLPVFTPPATDPAVATAKAQADAAATNSLQQIAQMDTASILARYGQQMSMTGAGSGSPLLMR